MMGAHMSIPAIRKRLYDLADEHGLDELRELADASYRRPPVRQAPTVFRTKMTEAQKAEIDALAETFAHMPLREIARRVGTDQGRVSEYLARKARKAA